MSETLQLPTILSLVHEGDGLVAELALAPELLYFRGHFPEHPILPGVVQIGWAEQLGRRHFPLPARFLALEALKFQDLILPGARLCLTLQFKPEKGKLEFSYESASGRHSAGRLVFTDAPA